VIVCVSSRIVYKDCWDEIKASLDLARVESFFPKEEDFGGKNDQEALELMKEITARFYKYIDQSDFLYVNAVNGDASRAVSCEIGYAKSKGLRILSSEEISELEIRAMIDEIVPVDKLTKYLIG
jgi:nucleoside 2-deoxyribosyltransferase